MTSSPSRFEEIAGALNTAQQVAVAWQGKAAGWMPYNIFEFSMLLLEAQCWVETGSEPKLLEIGAGPGPCLEVARVLGWNVFGIELSDQMAAAARERRIPVLTTDAASFGGYGDFAAVWFNRVYRNQDPDGRLKQMALEQKIWHDMRPGAVVICANLENPPPSSWFMINDSWGIEPEGLRRGVWAKPGG